MFRFKQFSVDQSGCAMKINTDGVLLGAMAEADKPAAVLDIGAGTGVIALMLAQRLTNARVDAVEIDQEAAETASKNFVSSPFAGRLTLYALGFEDYFNQFPARKYDLIVSNPPFYIDSLKSPGAKKALAKHTDESFFERLINSIASRLTPSGVFWLIIPVNIGEIVTALAKEKGIYCKNIVQVKSYPHSAAHRVMICLSFNKDVCQNTELIIYKSEGIYSSEYQTVLQPYFINF